MPASASHSLPTRRVFYTVLLLCLAITLSACAFTKMETANQLQDGEQVYSASLDNIGFGPIPRANFSVMQGIANTGDVSAHVGTTLFSANAGIGGRFYLGERVNLSLQGDVMTVIFGLPVSPHERFERFIVTAVPRITTAVKEGEFFYGGLQANVLTGFESENTQVLGTLGGLVLGMDFGSRASGGGFQGELVLHPIQYRDGDLTFFADLDESQVVLFQLSIGGYFW